MRLPVASTSPTATNSRARSRLPCGSLRKVCFAFSSPKQYVLPSAPTHLTEQSVATDCPSARLMAHWPPNSGSLAAAAGAAAFGAHTPAPGHAHTASNRIATRTAENNLIAGMGLTFLASHELRES